MTRRELWNLLKHGPAEYRPLIEGALLNRFGFFEIHPGRKLAMPFIEALNDRWIIILRAGEDPVLRARGLRAFPEFLLRRLAQRATFSLTINVDDLDLLKAYERPASLGARVLVVETDYELPSADEWEVYLDEHVPGRLEHWQRYPRTLKRIRKLEVELDHTKLDPSEEIMSL